MEKYVNCSDILHFTVKCLYGFSRKAEMNLVFGPSGSGNSESGTDPMVLVSTSLFSWIHVVLFSNASFRPMSQSPKS